MSESTRYVKQKPKAMENGKRDLLVLLKNDQQGQKNLDREVEYLNKILVSVERADVFCSVHELLARNRITNKASKIIKASSVIELKAFTFLINKN
jgi:predicted RNA binding protein with dsRBD fold (UPF0201 family)